MISCGLCGHQFTKEAGGVCRSGCPVATGCGMVTCPSCGYEFPPESKLVSALVRFGKRLGIVSAEP